MQWYVQFCKKKWREKKENDCTDFWLTRILVVQKKIANRNLEKKLVMDQQKKSCYQVNYSCTM